MAIIYRGEQDMNIGEEQRTIIVTPVEQPRTAPAPSRVRPMKSPAKPSPVKDPATVPVKTPARESAR
jgi:hypothetical protein